MLSWQLFLIFSVFFSTLIPVFSLHLVTYFVDILGNDRRPNVVSTLTACKTLCKEKENFLESKNCYAMVNCVEIVSTRQKQPSRGVPRKKCSEKATLLKSHFGIGVILLICCIFSEHLLLRTLLDVCF